MNYTALFLKGAVNIQLYIGTIFAEIYMQTVMYSVNAETRQTFP